jgi:anti-anti-sigma regulatory factor
VTEEKRLHEHPVGGIERRDGAVVVHLVGELDLYNAPEVRAALLEVCAEEP